MDQKTLEDLVRKYPCALVPNDDEGLTVITCPVRLAFAWLEKPKPSDNPNNKAKYQCAAIIPAFADVSKLEEIAMKAWIGSTAQKVRGTAKHKPLKPQAPNAEKYDGFGTEGFYFDAKTVNVVQIFGPDMQPLPADRIKSGYWARLKIRAYSYDTSGNWGVGFGLQAVQFIAEDTVFASNGNASDGFEAVKAPSGAGPARMPQSNGATATGW